jgi:hypothetical protein
VAEVVERMPLQEHQVVLVVVETVQDLVVEHNLVNLTLVAAVVALVVWLAVVVVVVVVVLLL